MREEWMVLMGQESLAARFITNVARTSGPREETAGMYRMGVFGEFGEALELYKKYKYHRKPLNRIRVVEELGDLLWYSVGDALCSRTPDAVQAMLNRPPNTGARWQLALASFLKRGPAIDVFWAAVNLFNAVLSDPLTLEEIAEANIQKLLERYP